MLILVAKNVFATKEIYDVVFKDFACHAQREKCCYISFSYLSARNVQKKVSCQVLNFNSFILQVGYIFRVSSVRPDKLSHKC